MGRRPKPDRGPSPSKPPTLQSLGFPFCEMGQTAGLHQTHAECLAHTGAHTQQLFRKPTGSCGRSREEGWPSLRGSRTSLTGEEGRRVTRPDPGCVPRSSPPTPPGERLRVPAGTCTTRVTRTMRRIGRTGERRAPWGLDLPTGRGASVPTPTGGASDFSTSIGN